MNETHFIYTAAKTCKKTKSENQVKGKVEAKTITIICFKIKNPPTLHSTSKIQPTTSRTFVFSAFGSVRKTWGYEIKLLTVVLVLSSSCLLVNVNERSL
jgi:hypothetical protein